MKWLQKWTEWEAEMFPFLNIWCNQFIHSCNYSWQNSTNYNVVTQTLSWRLPVMALTTTSVMMQMSIWNCIKICLKCNVTVCYNCYQWLVWTELPAQQGKKSWMGYLFVINDWPHIYLIQSLQNISLNPDTSIQYWLTKPVKYTAFTTSCLNITTMQKNIQL